MSSSDDDLPPDMRRQASTVPGGVPLSSAPAVSASATHGSGSGSSSAFAHSDFFRADDIRIHDEQAEQGNRWRIAQTDYSGAPGIAANSSSTVIPTAANSSSSSINSLLLGASLPAPAPAADLPSLTPRRRQLGNNSRSPSPAVSPMAGRRSIGHAEDALAPPSVGLGLPGSPIAAQSSPRSWGGVGMSRGMSGEAQMSQIRVYEDENGSPRVRLHVGDEAETPPRPAASSASAAPAAAPASAPAAAAAMSEEMLVLLVNEADALVRAEATANQNASSSSSAIATAASSSSSSSLDLPIWRFASYESRLTSILMRPWPHSAATHPHLSPEALARAGFFSPSSKLEAGDDESDDERVADTLRCYACGAVCSEWESNDEPLQAHRNAQLETLIPCPFLHKLDLVREQQSYGAGSSSSSGNRGRNDVPRLRFAALPAGSSSVPAASSAPGGIAVLDRRPTLNMLLDDRFDMVSPRPTIVGAETDRRWLETARGADGEDAMSDELPPMAGSSSALPPGLARSASVAEKKQIEISETPEQRRRAIVSTRAQELEVAGLRVERKFPSASSSSMLDESKDASECAASSSISSADEPVTFQTRQPLLSFSPDDSSTSFAPRKQPSLLYFQVKILRLTQRDPTTTRRNEVEAAMRSASPPVARQEGGADVQQKSLDLASADDEAGKASPPPPASSSCASSATTPAPASASSSNSFAPLLIGLSTVPLHSSSAPPGYAPPASSLLDVGLSSTGELFLNGQGPMSGVVGMQNMPFWNYRPPSSAGDAATTGAANDRDASSSPLLSPSFADAAPAPAPSLLSSSSQEHAAPPPYWKSGDVIGCKVDLVLGVIFWHVNGHYLGGPVPMPSPPPALPAAEEHLAIELGLASARGGAAGGGGSSSPSTPSSPSASSAAPSRLAAYAAYRFFPTCSLLYPGDAIEIQLVGDPSQLPLTRGGNSSLMASSGFNDLAAGHVGLGGFDASRADHHLAMGFDRPLLGGSSSSHFNGDDGIGQRALLAHWNLPSENDVVSRSIALLADRTPDLGLVLTELHGGEAAEFRRRNSSVVGPVPVPPVSSAAVPLRGKLLPTNAAKSLLSASPVMISKINPSSPATHAGLMIHDEIRSINGSPIRALNDAVLLVTKSSPGSVLLFEIMRRGRVCLLPLTLGAKKMTLAEVALHARWIQWQRNQGEWVGPPALLPNVEGVLKLVQSDAASSAAASSSAAAESPASMLHQLLPSLPNPPAYVSGSHRPWNAVEHITAMEIALVIERRLKALSPAAAKGGLYLPQYRTVESRVATFGGQMQSWLSAYSAASSSSSSSSSAASPASPRTAHPPKPFNVAMHGFLYAPLPGFLARCICFSCGLVLPEVRSVSGLLDAHRLGALALKQLALADTLPSMARPPSYHRDASIQQVNLDTGCLFLTIYDSVSSNLAQARRMKKQQQANERAAKAARMKAITSGGVAGASAPVAPLPVDVVIDVETEDSQKRADGGSSHVLVVHADPEDTDAVPATRTSLDEGKRPLPRGMVVPNQDHLSHPHSPGSLVTPLATLPPGAISLAPLMGKTPRGTPTSPPPDYAAAQNARPIAMGAAAVALRMPNHKVDEGVVYQSRRQAKPKEARVGEFSPGAIHLGQDPLSPYEAVVRNRGRPAAAAAGQAVRFNVDDDVDAPVEGGAYVPPPPPPPVEEEDALEALRHFFLDGSLCHLIWKIPLFILLLPFFLVYELVKGTLRCIVWSCEALDRQCTRCCSWIGNACAACCEWMVDTCARCWNFICCTVLCECICENIYQHCLKPIGRCISWVCTQIHDCCLVCFEVCVLPVCKCIQDCCNAVYNALARCCTVMCEALGRCCNAIYRALAYCCNGLAKCCSAVCEAVGKCCEVMCDAIGRCCTAFWTPICKCLSAVCEAIYSCLATVCTKIGECLSAVCSAIGDCCEWLCNGLGRCCKAVCNAVSICCEATCSMLGRMCSAIGRCIDYACIQPISWLCTKLWEAICWVSRGVWACLSTCWEYLVVRPLKALWACISAVAGCMWEYMLVPIGQFIAWVGRGIAACLTAVGKAVWAVLSAIGSGVWAVLSAIGSGVWAVLSAVGGAVWAVLSAVGRGVSAVFRAIWAAARAAGRAIRELFA